MVGIKVKDEKTRMKKGKIISGDKVFKTNQI